jgi:Alpha-L-rhamnosidase N-terminal domain./Bacterial alpha-L-rhamnosidase.
MSVFERFKAEWIWLQQEFEKVNQYVEFRHEFMMDEADCTDASLYISVDTEYAVWLNGGFVNCGQYDDYPDKKVYDVLQVSSLLKPGRNVLYVLAYYQGENSFQYVKGLPGLIYSIRTGKLHISSGNGTLCRESLTYKCGTVPKISEQLAFSFEYNAISDDGWLFEDYEVDSSWKVPVKTKHASVLNERPIKKLDIKEKVIVCIKSQGVFIRIPDDEKSVAQLMQSDYLSQQLAVDIFTGSHKRELPCADGVSLCLQKVKDGQGAYFLIDMRREEVGLLELELNAGEGTILDIAYGEHLDDLRVRAAIGGRNFAVRYICKEGLQKFTYYFKRIAGRYIQLHVSNIQEKFVLYYAGVRPVEYPIDTKGRFYCGNHLFNKIYDVAVRTAHLCMHEHYEDTPWREQALYGMDSRLQALCGYYCFGDYDFPISSFELLGDSMREDGYLQICAPSEFHVTIPSFCMAWVMELGDYLLFSGRTERLKSLLPKIKRMLSLFLRRVQDGLMLRPIGNNYWNFYEWTEGLDNCEPLIDPEYKGNMQFDAPLNLFLCMALESAANISRCCGDVDAAKEYEEYAIGIKKEFHKCFWNEKIGSYKSYTGEGCTEHYAELVQALAICAGACPEDLAPALREKLSVTDNGLIKTSLSYSLYKYQALLEEPHKYGENVFNQIARDWGYMLYNGATSFWETIAGADDFNYGGSLSHGWSAIPVYFFHAYVLGIRPLEPGFKTFKAEPIPSLVNYACGRVPTPYGNIDIQWSGYGSEAKLKVNYPEEISLKDLSGKL